jgi:fucose permease
MLDKQQMPVSRRHMFLVFAAFVLIGANTGGLGVLIPDIRAFYHIDASTFSWMFVLYVLGYLTASLNTGWLHAHVGARRLILLALAVFLLGVGLISLGMPFLVYLLLVSVLGCGVGMIDAGLNAYVASLPRNAVFLNYLHAFWGMGALIGPLVASLLLQWQWHWQAAYRTWFCLALVLSVGFWCFFRPPTPFSVAQAAPAQTKRLLLQALRLRVVWLAALFLLLYVGAEIGLGNWGYSFLTIARQSPALFSAWVVSGYWLGLTIGRLTLANLSARLGIRPLILVCLAGVLAGLLLAWSLPGLWGAAPGLYLLGFFLGPIFPTTIAWLSQVVPARLLASAVGFLFALGNVGGALFPSLAGTLLQHLGFWFLPPFALIITVLMVGSWLLLGNVSPHQMKEG